MEWLYVFFMSWQTMHFTDLDPLKALVWLSEMMFLISRRQFHKFLRGKLLLLGPPGAAPSRGRTCCQDM